MKILLVVGMMLVPCVVLAATDCRLTEYPDHFEAVCIGEAPQFPDSLQIPVPPQVPREARTRGRPGDNTVQEQTATQDQVASQGQTLGYVPGTVPGQTTMQSQIAVAEQTGGQAGTPEAGQAVASAQEQPDTAPQTALLYTRRGKFWIHADDSGGYTATPTYTPQG